MLTGLLATAVGAGLFGWLGGRLHLRANQLKALDRKLNVPAGSLEQKVNAATAQGITLAAGHVVDIINKPGSVPPGI